MYVSIRSLHPIAQISQPQFNMFSITIPAGSKLSYSVPALSVTGYVPEIQADISEGTHLFTSDSFELGTVISAEGRRLIGRIAFSYTYDAARRTMTVAGTEFSSKDTMVLVTQAEGIDEICVERTVSHGLTLEESHQNRFWNYRTQLVPGAEKVFNLMLRNTNKAMIESLKQQKDLIVQVRTPLPALSTEHYLSLCTVHRNGVFLGMYDKDKDYGPDIVIGNPESTWGGTVYMNYGENFANVIGSTGDPHIAGKSWIKLWADQFSGYPTICTSYNYGGFVCGNTFVGGHVILGQTAHTVATGSNSVYIYPICHAHNNNDNVYMAAVQYLDGVWLNNFQQ